MVSRKSIPNAQLNEALAEKVVFAHQNLFAPQHANISSSGQAYESVSPLIPQKKLTRQPRKYAPRKTTALVERLAPSQDCLIDRIVRLPELLGILQVSRTTLFTWVKNGYFCAPLHLSERIRGWRLSEVKAFLATRTSERGHDI